MTVEEPREDALNEHGEPILEIRNLKKYFDQSEGILDRLIGSPDQVQALDGVDVTVNRGETVAIVGESGCGKSTLARTIMNLERATEGTVEYKGEDITALSDSEMRPFRRRIQMIFQDALASLNPRQTVESILKKPMRLHGIGESDDERTERAREELERVGLKASHLNRYPHQFSGGQQQRIAIARALTLDPDLLVADEPVSALDVSVQAQVLNLLDDLREELDLSIVFIAHDLSVVRHISDRVVVMYLGKVVERAPTDVLFTNPQHPYTKSLLSAVPRLNVDKDVDRILLRGTVPSPISPPSGCRFHTRCPAVIPSDEWTGTQREFREVLTFRKRIENGEISPSDVRARLSNEERAQEDVVVEELLAESLDIRPDELSEKAKTAVYRAAQNLVAGDNSGATDSLREISMTPCEREEPVDVTVGDGHGVACHRIDPDQPGEADFL